MSHRTKIADELLNTLEKDVLTAVVQEMARRKNTASSADPDSAPKESVREPVGQLASDAVSDNPQRRAALLAEYKIATGNPSNRRIYTARNSGIHKPEFYDWLNCKLPPTSQTAINFERFLREKKKPLPREKH